MFRNAQVGDRVWDYERNCWGTIISISKECHYPLKVKLDNKYSEELYYTIDGKSSTRNVNPSLFWNEIKIDIPQKPFNLEKELRKLKIKKYKSNEGNYHLHWDNELKCIKDSVNFTVESPSIIYFTQDSIDNFINKIQFKTISKEEFFSAYKKVFG